MFSQGSVATYARSGGTFNSQFTTHLPKNLPVKNFINRLRFDRIMAVSLWPHFLAQGLYMELKLTPEAAAVVHL